MNVVSIVLVVNEPSFSIEVEKMLQETGNVSLSIFRNAASCKNYLSMVSTSPDLLLIDLSLEGAQDGLELAEEIKDLAIPFAFLTRQKKEANLDRIKALRPIAFLIKPFDAFSLHTVVDSTLHYTNSKAIEKKSEEESIFLRQNNQFIRLYFNDILWVKSDGNYCLIKTNDRRFIIKRSLVKFCEELPKGRFVQVHRRYVVQFSFIDRVDIQTNIAHIGEEEISIGGKFKAALVKRLKGE